MNLPMNKGNTYITKAQRADGVDYAKQFTIEGVASSDVSSPLPDGFNLATSTLPNVVIITRTQEGEIFVTPSSDFKQSMQLYSARPVRLRVAHFPQIPCKPFHVDVSSVEEGVLVMNTLANYDLFQLENNIKPDYASASYLEQFSYENQSWEAWQIEFGNDSEHWFDDPREYLAFLRGESEDAEG